MITDLSYLESMSGNNTDFIAEIVSIFREQIDEYIIQLPELLDKSDFENLSKVAHKAKSSVAVMGMTNEAELMKNLEIYAKNEIEVNTYKGLIGTFIKNSGLALEELDEYLKNKQS
ncbi:MAG: Hpt domain-containing protein [Bacteroidales bacterium]